MVDDRTIINYMAFSMAYENQEETSTKVVTLTTNKASGNAWMNVSLDATYVINKQRTPFGGALKITILAWCRDSIGPTQGPLSHRRVQFLIASPDVVLL
jgi:hypothetical protein